MSEFKVICGDCFEILKSMPDKSVDHIITDPPYGEKTHKGARGGNEAKKTMHQNNSLIDFAHISEERFFEFCFEAIRVTRRWVIMTCEWKYAAKVEEHLRLGKYFVRLGVWVKPNAAPQFTGDRPGQGMEAVLILHDTYKKSWNGGGHHAIWTHNIVHGPHKTQKPPGLVKEWIQQFTDAGEVILDPFCGSGTVGECAVEMGRNFIGIEIDPKWHRYSLDRVTKAANQYKLVWEA